MKKIYTNETLLKPSSDDSNEWGTPYSKGVVRMKILQSFLKIAIFASMCLPLSLQAATTRYASPTGTATRCISVDSSCSLSTAIDVALDGDEIKLAAGTYTAPTGSRATGVIHVNKNLTFQGALDGITTIDGQNQKRVFHIFRDKSVIISNVLITGGKVTEAGAGILNSGNLILKDSFVQYNIVDTTTGTSSSTGGGIYNNGTAVLNNVVLQNNKADEGAGIANVHSDGSVPKLTIFNSSIVNNGTSALVTGRGAGILNIDGELYLANVTVSGNKTRGRGAGIHQTSGTSVVHFSTIYNNHADKDTDRTAGPTTEIGGGVHIEAGNMSILGTVIAGNLVGLGNTPNDCYSTATGDALLSYNINLIGALDSSCNLRDMTRRGILTGTPENPLNPQLRPLPLSTVSLGALGLQRTHTPLPGSPVIDKIAQADCKLGIAADSLALTIDQRGLPRPYGADHKCDLGAVEATPALVPLDTNAYRYPDTTVASTAAHNLVLTNVGDIPMSVTAASVDNANFNVNFSACAAIVAGANCTLIVNFAPTQVGDQHGVLSVTTTAPFFDHFTYTLDGKALAAAGGGPGGPGPHDQIFPPPPPPNPDTGGCSMNPASMGGWFQILPFVFAVAGLAMRRKK